MEVRAIVDALAADGHQSHLLLLRKGTEIPLVAELPDNVPVVCQGPAFVPRAMNYPRLRPGIFYHPEAFRWSAYQLGWREAMLSGDGRVVPLATASP